ncbi:uracil-DNA glycosylase family protein [Pelagicoccus sp. SDUM812005]|uniref:uracil-DNA glycosylase family protein n=1 Tax=Pelagicoccus sp. SDUM812005 TaxID=3041257 RepID=UPI00280F2CDB|nr:uracil-DNA glycosylase family protein [Pelagicoccus sp. SDUM812005]MDQ8180902.1 single-stranded DNA-binding protein [Pelagicoccus sp. SDUM812005]
MSLAPKLAKAAKELCKTVDSLTFSEPVAYVYNPLDYAWKPQHSYLKKYGAARKRVVFMGMNPGPWGMSQTGVPFGEIDSVKNWMGINEPVGKPTPEHPKRPVVGFDCDKSEVSGRRLWGLFAERYPQADDFFAEHFVLNYCPLVFMEESSRNRTPDKLPAAESAPLFQACNLHLRRCIEILQPEWIVGVGGFAQTQAKDALQGIDIKHGKVLHPSPASPAANRGWAEAATKQLLAQGIWTE